MTEASEAKVAALKRLLPLLVGYLMDSPMGRTVGRLDRVGGRGADTTDNLGWLDLKEQEGARYRMEAVTRSMAGLWEYDRRQAFAVWYSFVDPWENFEPRSREALADEGLRWMAKEIPGRLWAPGDEKEQRKTEKLEEAQRLRDSGMTRDAVAAAVHMSARDVPKAKKRRKRGRKK